jgi:hypothetical protein
MNQEIEDWNRFNIANSIRILQKMFCETPNELEDFCSYSIKELQEIKYFYIKKMIDLQNKYKP